MIKTETPVQRTSIQFNDVRNNLQIVLDLLILFVKILIEIPYVALKFIIRDSPKDISGDIVLITGTASGIGRELAIQYTSQGCIVICVDINEKGNEETVQIANAQNRGTAYGFKCDVSDRSQVVALSDDIRGKIGIVSVIINNAGISQCHRICDFTEKEIRQIMDVNVLSHFWIIKTFLPGMQEISRGHIIAISSIAGILAVENEAPYCASKFAVCGLMESLSEEIRKGPHSGKIHTTTICPGMVDTPILRNPRMRFPNIIRIMKATTAASDIIDAHRRNFKQVTIPKDLRLGVSILRMLPINISCHIRDFIDCGVDPE